MSSRKLIVVLGATGNQGGSVVTTFLQDPSYRIRGITRNPQSSKSLALQSKGVEMVIADLDDDNSLTAAFQGANVIFSTTDYWGLFMDPEVQKKAAEEGQSPFEYCYGLELQQGKNVFDAAAKIEGLERFIFSGLSDASKWSGGTLRRVFHFDAKAHAAEYGKENHAELWAKTSVLQVGWYLSNFLTNPFLKPKKSDDGSYALAVGLPSDLKVPMMATANDTGPLVKALLNDGPGVNLIGYREQISMDELTDTWSRTLNVPAKFARTPLDKDAEDEFIRGQYQNMKYFEDFGYEGREDPSVVHPRDLRIPADFGSVEEWIKEQDWSAVLG